MTVAGSVAAGGDASSTSTGTGSNAETCLGHRTVNTCAGIGVTVGVGKGVGVEVGVGVSVGATVSVGPAWVAGGVTGAQAANTVHKMKAGT